MKINKRDLWNAEHKCISCSRVMNKKIMLIEGMKVRAWECLKCNETTLHPEDAQRILILNKLRKGISVKIGKLGASLIMRFPKEIIEFYKINKGEKAILLAENRQKIEIKLESN